MEVLHGGIARYSQNTGKYVFEYCTDSIARLYGCTKEELWNNRTHDALDVICSCDRQQAEQILRDVREKGVGLKAYFRIHGEHKVVSAGLLGRWGGFCYPDFRNISGNSAVPECCKGDGR